MARYPELNYCSQCGGPLQDRHIHGRTRRYCPACDCVIFRDPKVAAGVLVQQDGSVLLVQRGAGPRSERWSIPAGFVEYDETPTVTATRECHEETGLEIELTKLLDVVAGGGLPGEASFLVIYRGRVIGGQLHAADDATQAAFFPLGNLPPLAFPSTEQALRFCE